MANALWLGILTEHAQESCVACRKRKRAAMARAYSDRMPFGGVQVWRLEFYCLECADEVVKRSQELRAKVGEMEAGNA